MESDAHSFHSPHFPFLLQVPLLPPLSPVVSCRGTGTVHLCVLDGKQQTLPDPFHSPASHAYGCCGTDLFTLKAFTRGGRRCTASHRQALLPLPGEGHCLLQTSPSWVDSWSAFCGGCQECNLTVWQLSKSCKGSVYHSVWTKRAFVTHSTYMYDFC